LNILEISAMAFAPCLAIIIFIYWKDKYQKEPLILLAISFFLGVVSAAPAILFTSIMEKLFMGFQMFYVLKIAVLSFVVIGFSEEFSKYLFLVLFPYKNKTFDEPYDGITYAVMISMGFATLENVVYMLSHGHEVIYIRAFTSVPAHACFAVIMGFFVGLAKFRNNSFSLKMMGLFLAAALHGFYDFFLFLENIPLIAFGALFSLIIGIRLSFNAIHLHNEFSPFNPLYVKVEDDD
jgi:RsiW-degrading membrane proteinase PrsW (M82 family)